MAIYISRSHARQRQIFPASMEDHTDEDNPVRIIEVFVDGFDLRQGEAIVKVHR